MRIMLSLMSLIYPANYCMQFIMDSMFPSLLHVNLVIVRHLTVMILVLHVADITTALVTNCQGL